MPFEKKIFGTEHCPRCNAIAQLRVHKTDTKMVQLRLDCPKCKLSKLVKVTTQKFLDLECKEKVYRDLLQNIQPGRKKDQVLKILERIRKEKYVAEVQP